MTDIISETKKRLNLIRRIRGLSQLDAAKKAKIGQSTLSQIEIGNKVPSLLTLNMLLKAYKITPGKFYTFEVNV